MHTLTETYGGYLVIPEQSNDVEFQKLPIVVVSLLPFAYLSGAVIFGIPFF